LAKSSKVSIPGYIFCAAYGQFSDLLKLSDETDLDILNHSMEVMVHCFQDELLPVAAQLTARLVRVERDFRKVD
jgi:hypothetical protein